MVSINSKMSGLSDIKSTSTLARNRNNTPNTLDKHSDQKFSSLFDKAKNESDQSKKIQTINQQASTYSPLMVRYGANKINEIKNIASSYGVNDLTNEDFDYAIRYGRSIIADYLV
jgi:hypothetical protein